MSGAQTAPPGMQRIPLPLESYVHPSVPLTSQKLLNFMAEGAPSDARSPAALIPSLGLRTYLNLGSGPIKATNDNGAPGAIFLVSGTHAFRINLGLTITVDDLGDVGVPDTGVLPPHDIMITIAVGPAGTVFCVPPRSYFCGPTDTAVSEMGGTYPGAATVTYHDGYYVFTAYENSAKWFISRLIDPVDFDALDFAYADAFPNVIRRVMPLRGNIWICGENGIEVWYDAGQADFPYRRVSGGAIQSVSHTPRALAVADNSLFWINNASIVFRSNNFVPVRISTHAIERAILAAGGAPALISAFAYSLGGHITYVMNFPQMTLVYDCTTQKWHNRTSSDASGRWRPDCVAAFGSSVLFGDSLGSAVFLPQLDVGREDGAWMYRSLTLPPLYAGTRRAYCSRLEIELESADPGLEGGVTLDWSDDGGFNFTGGPRVMEAGAATGNRRQRVYTTRLGSFRERVFRIQLLGHMTVYGVDADIVGGAH